MVSNGRLVVSGVPQGERAKVSPEALEVIFLDEIAGRLEDLGEHMTALARGIQSRGRSKGLGGPGAMVEEAAAAGTPYRYAVKKYLLTDKKQDVVEVVYADYFDYSTDGDPSNITVRFDDPNAQEIPLDMFKGIPIPGGFRKVFLSWPAQSGKTLTVFYGLGIAASGLGTISLPQPAASAPFPIIIPGRYSGSSSDYQSLAKWTVPDGKTGNLLTITFGTDQPGSAQWKVTIPLPGVGFEDKYFQFALALPFPDNGLPGGSVVEVWVKSDGTQAIVADAAITGTQR